MYSAQLSKQIFKHLMGGKVLNKDEFNNSGELVENRLFQEICENLTEYRTQYKMAGFELVFCPSYCFIRHEGESDPDLHSDFTMKVSVLLLILGKYLTTNNYKLSKISSPDAGLIKSDIDEIDQSEEASEILEKAGYKKGAFNAIKNTLIDRGFLMEKPSTETYVLSNSGIAFFDGIVNDYLEIDNTPPIEISN